MANKQKTLLIDIETAPKRGYVWGLWKQNIAPSQLITDWFMLTWSAKWEGSSKIMGQKIHKDDVFTEDDSSIMPRLWELMDEADIVVGHNGDRFDIPSINTRFIMNDLSPASPYRQVDTLKIAKRHFKFTSNRLDYIARALGIGGKIETGGFSLWDRCMLGKSSALSDMLKYNKRDVDLLEKVYQKLKPYAGIHPSVAVESSKKDKKCPRCGSSSIQKKGTYKTNVSVFQRYKCTDCGSWSRGRENLLTKEERCNIIVGV